MLKKIPNFLFITDGRSVANFVQNLGATHWRPNFTQLLATTFFFVANPSLNFQPSVISDGKIPSLKSVGNPAHSSSVFSCSQNFYFF